VEDDKRSLPHPYQKGDLIWHIDRKRFGFITKDTIDIGSRPVLYIDTIDKALTIKEMTELDYIKYKGTPGFWFVHKCIRIANKDEKSILAVLIKYA
jgi:hypothetical protein